MIIKCMKCLLQKKFVHFFVVVCLPHKTILTTNISQKDIQKMHQ